MNLPNASERRRRRVTWSDDVTDDGAFADLSPQPRSTNTTQDGGRECVSVMDWNGRAKNTQSRAERRKRNGDGRGDGAVDAGDAVTGHQSD